MVVYKWQLLLGKCANGERVRAVFSLSSALKWLPLQSDCLLASPPMCPHSGGRTDGQMPAPVQHGSWSSPGLAWRCRAQRIPARAFQGPTGAAARSWKGRSNGKAGLLIRSALLGPGCCVCVWGGGDELPALNGFAVHFFQVQKACPNQEKTKHKAHLQQ